MSTTQRCSSRVEWLLGLTLLINSPLTLAEGSPDPGISSSGGADEFSFPDELPFEEVNGFKVVPGELIIKFKKSESSPGEEGDNDVQQTMGIECQTLPNIEAKVCTFVSATSVGEVIDENEGNPNFEYIEPNYYVHALATTPNDPYFGNLWGFNNTGQTGGTKDADIDAPEAWDITTGGDVIIAVIDTGVDYLHPDLAANMWKNLGEIPGNGRDDDGNGYVDDVYGYDTVNWDGDPRDDHSHGSHCAGSIAAVGNNGVGIVGVNWRAKIMALKFLDKWGFGTTANAILALNYAVKMGAQISNNSWGGGPYSQALYDAIKAAGEKGHLFVAAAGNSGTNNDGSSPFYPASYNLDNIISVAATNHQDKRSSFSNYGLKTVDLGAPGENIYSTLLSPNYGYKSGTSMASPLVAGVAGLLMGCRKSGWSEVKQRIMDTVDPLTDLAGKMISGGRLNLFKAVEGFCKQDIGSLYVVNDRGLNNSQLYYTELFSPAFVPLGPLYEDCDLEALDISKTDDLYAAAGDNTPRPGHLYKVNKKDGDIVDLGDLGGPTLLDEVDAISFNPANGQLWGWAQCEGLFTVPQIPTASQSIQPLVDKTNPKCKKPTSAVPNIAANLVFSYPAEVEDIEWNEDGSVLYAVENEHLAPCNQLFPSSPNHARDPEVDSHGSLEDEWGQADFNYDFDGKDLDGDGIPDQGGVKLWAYSVSSGIAKEICSQDLIPSMREALGMPAEIEALESLPRKLIPGLAATNQDLLLAGFHGPAGLHYLVIVTPSPNGSADSHCNIIWKEEISFSGNDVEGIAYSPNLKPE